MENTFGKDVISITDEEGVEYELEVLAAVTYRGAEYLALVAADADEDADELEVSILKSVTDESGDPTLLTVENGEELEAVYNLLINEMYDEEDDGGEAEQEAPEF